MGRAIRNLEMNACLDPRITLLREPRSGRSAGAQSGRALARKAEVRREMRWPTWQMARSTNGKEANMWNTQWSVLARSGLPEAVTMKRWFLGPQQSYDLADSPLPEEETEDHLLTASIAAATALVVFAVLIVVVTVAVVVRLVAAWISQA